MARREIMARVMWEDADGNLHSTKRKASYFSGFGLDAVEVAVLRIDDVDALVEQVAEAESVDPCGLLHWGDFSEEKKEAIRARVRKGLRSLGIVEGRGK